MYKLSQTFETGIWDRHKLISTVAKSGNFKGRPREKIYRSYRSFKIETFKKTLSDKLSRLESNSYSEFEKVFLTVLNEQAPLTTKFIIGTTKAIIMKTGIYIKNKGIFV